MGNGGSLCTSTRSCASMALGLVSVLSWGVAEVPQIITNYREKSTEGLSIAFLSTWIIGDLFNLAGCWLEPATLPTQFYTALLYTATTVVLTGQTAYYGHMYRWLRADKGRGVERDETGFFKSSDDLGEGDGSGAAKGAPLMPSSPISVSASVAAARCPGGSLYIASARSLSSSPKPTSRSFLGAPRGSGLATPRSREEHSAREPLLGDAAFSQSAPPHNTKSMLSVVMSTVLCLGGLGLRHSRGERLKKPSTGKVILVGRKILQENVSASPLARKAGSSGIGSFLGWAMAVIYMGGRLPQICLNMRRGTVEGLSPLMFGFALVGNATYVASILVSSLDWSRISPNLPWLVDAGGCVLLDSFCHADKSAETTHEDD